MDTSKEKNSPKFEVVTPTLSGTVMVKDMNKVREFMIEQIKKRDEILAELRSEGILQD